MRQQVRFLPGAVLTSSQPISSLAAAHATSKLHLSAVPDMALNRLYLRVRGKGAKDRLVPAPRLYRRLRIYIERGRPRDAVSSRIFLSHRRRPNGDYQPLTTSGVDQMVR